MVAIIGTVLHWSDILVLLSYFIIILGFGVWVGRRERETLVLIVSLGFRVHARIEAVLVRSYLLAVD